MSKYKSPFTEEQEQFIRDNCATMYVQDIVYHLEVNYDRVYKYIGRFKLPQKKVMRGKKRAEVVNGFFNVDAKDWAI